MSKKRGLSLDEKRKGMLEIFYEKKEFFQLKELEKIAPKEKGIITQSVKDVVQGLVDDCMVDSDKIGTSVYFWAYPSKAVNIRKQKLCYLEEKLHAAKKKRLELETKLDVAKCDRKDEEGRNVILEQLKGALESNEDLKSKLKQYEELDPDVLESMKKESEMAQTSVNRWTDNIFSVKTWCKDKFYMEDSLLNKQFGIPEDLDYL